MTNSSITISFKLPVRIAEHIPAPGNGRSGFIVQALEEKIARKKPEKWRPATERGRKLAALLAKGRAERHPLLNETEFEQELAARRGRSF